MKIPEKIFILSLCIVTTICVIGLVMALSTEYKTRTTPTPPPVQEAVQDRLTKRQVVALEILNARMGYRHKYPYSTTKEIEFAYTIADMFLEVE